MLALSVAAPVAAVSVSSEDVPSEAKVGSEVSATVELAELYSENDRWLLNATTELENKPKWTLKLIDDGDVVETKTRVGQRVTFNGTTIESPIDHVEVSVEGTVPAVENYSYAEQEMFTMLSVAQVPVTSSGETGAASTIETYEIHHYTAASKEARTAIDEAAAAIQNAQQAGADVSEAKGALGDAKGFYRNGDFDAAVTNAKEAKQLAREAKQQKQSSQQTQQLLIYAGVGVVVLALVGGGVYWYKQNQQDTSRLG